MKDRDLEHFATIGAWARLKELAAETDRITAWLNTHSTAQPYNAAQIPDLHSSPTPPAPTPPNGRPQRRTMTAKERRAVSRRMTNIGPRDARRKSADRRLSRVASPPRHHAGTGTTRGKRSSTGTRSTRKKRPGGTAILSCTNRPALFGISRYTRVSTYSRSISDAARSSMSDT